jgi:hypothetical protein
MIESIDDRRFFLARTAATLDDLERQIREGNAEIRRRRGERRVNTIREVVELEAKRETLLEALALTAKVTA